MLVVSEGNETWILPHFSFLNTILITMSNECHPRWLGGCMSVCTHLLETATMEFWLEEMEVTTPGAGVPRLGHGMTSSAELHCWQSTQGLRAQEKRKP